MKKYLPSFLQVVYVVPDWVGLLLFFLSFFFLLINNGNVAILLFLSSILISLVLLFGHSIAIGRVAKMKLGVNPQYLLDKFPGDLNAQIDYLITQEGFSLANKTETSAVLQRKRELNIASTVIWFLLGIIPGIIYLIWYFTRSPETVQLSVKAS